jgi:hypothetical protein
MGTVGFVRVGVEDAAQVFACDEFGQFAGGGAFDLAATIRAEPTSDSSEG